MSPNKFADIRIRDGDRVEIVSPGGGGYGPPAERDPELVCEEVRDGVLSERQAREVYRVALVTGDAAAGWHLDATRNRTATLAAMSAAEGHWEPIPDALYATTTARAATCAAR